MKKNMLLALSFILVSCGPTVKKKEQEQLRVESNSEQNSTEQFSLVDKNAVKGYGTGSLLFFNPEITPDAVANLLRLTKQRDQALVDRINYQYDAIVQPNFTKFHQQKEKLDGLRSEKVQRVAAVTADLRDRWFEGELSKIKASVDVKRSKLVFKYYCEAKVWERALFKLMLEAKFSQRPSPAYLCEGVYRQAGLFEYGQDEGACQKNEKGQNYFGCLWTHGLLKTELFKKYRFGEKTEIGKKIKSIDASLLYENLLFQPRLANSILQQKPFKLYASQANRSEPLLRLKRGKKFDLPAFERDSVYSIIFNLENQRGRFFVVDQKGEAVGADLTKTITRLSKFFSGPSVNEYLFNVPYGVGLSSDQRSVRKEELAPVENNLKPLLDVSIPGLDDDLANAENDLKTMKLAIVDANKELVATECKKAANLRCKEQATHLKLIDYVRNPLVTKMLITNAQLHLKKLASGLAVELKFGPESKKVLKGCIKDSGCAEVLPAKESNLAAQFSEDGYLEISFALPNTAAELEAMLHSVGWTKEESDRRGQYNYNELPVEQLLGAKMGLTIRKRSEVNVSDPSVKAITLLKGSIELRIQGGEVIIGSLTFRELDSEIVSRYEALLTQSEL